MNTPNPEFRRLMETVGMRCTAFLEEEVSISTVEISYLFQDVQRLELEYLTALVSVGGYLQVIFAFSFEERLAQAITKAYTAELELEDGEEEFYLEETVGDLSNIVLGNSLKYFQIQEKAITFQPPIVITQAKKITRDKQAKFLTAKLKTQEGIMYIYCIGPGEIFDNQLNYIAEEK